MIKTIYIIQWRIQDLQIKGAPVIQTMRKGGSWYRKKFIRPSGPQFGLIIRRGPGPPGPHPGFATEIIYNHVMKIKRILKIL